MCELTAMENKLYDLLMTNDFDYEAFETELKTGKYSADDVSIAALRYVCDCNDYDDIEYENQPFGVIQPGFYSSHMYQALKLMLDYGLDPNRIYTGPDHRFEEDNIIIALYFIGNGYLSADCLALLLEHGGNPCIKTPEFNLVEEVYDDMSFWFFNAENPFQRYRFDIDIHFFMVLAAYGGHFKDGQGMIDMREGHDVSELKDHRNFYYGGIDSDRSNDHFEICFFDKRTNYEVGRY